ncbi:MAG TPA: hydroxymethylglutaryl-CoA lyase [Alicycliphilus sp.]|nr:hydroxymethylglutaryl-CoA lyase [Alicycliphilus sp.]
MAAAKNFAALMSDRRVHINDVAMRDGLQIEPAFVPTEQKIAMVNALSLTGLSKIEVTSFTSPKAIPALRDAEQVMMEIDRVPGVRYVALAPNMRGAQRALECRVDEINLVMSASETHNLANTRMTMAQSRAVLTDIIREARGRAAVNISLSTAFGCPMEGHVAPEAVYALGDWFAGQGADGITLCDTTGMANPMQVAELAEGLDRRWPGMELTLHFHNTRGMGLANVIAGLIAGIDRYDASLGGVGGCPYAPGATGNICTEDLVHMLDTMGVASGVDVDKLLACAARLPALLGHDIPGAVLRAGKSDGRHPPPADLEAIRARALARETA